VFLQFTPFRDPQRSVKGLVDDRGDLMLGHREQLAGVWHGISQKCYRAALYPRFYGFPRSSELYLDITRQWRLIPASNSPKQGMTSSGLQLAAAEAGKSCIGFTAMHPSSFGGSIEDS
jgi:hypothetical protein